MIHGKMPENLITLPEREKFLRDFSGAIGLRDSVNASRKPRYIYTTHKRS